MTAPPATVFPATVEDLTPEILTAALAAGHPGVEVAAIEDATPKMAGEGAASTADRVVLDLTFRPGCSAGLPRRMILKTMLVTPHAPAVMYETEVRFYRDVRPEAPIETPRAFASLFDEGTGRFGILMEDLGLREARFPNATQRVAVDEIRSLVGGLAALHARFWESPRFASDLDWVPTHFSGGMHDVFTGIGLEFTRQQVRQADYKAEILRALDRTVDRAWQDIWAMHRRLDARSVTLLHGDTHLGNTYLLPDGGGGFLDWQLMVRGNWAHDVTYLLITGLTTDLRRAHERDLIDFYLGELRRRGVDGVPTRDEAWDSYRRAVVWGLMIGWMITPPQNYGEDITRANLDRLAAAADDLGTFALLDEGDR